MTTERYNAREAEPRWQKIWDEGGIFAARNDDPRPRYYVLEMFPYPSGRIHMGHVRNYTMGDVVARYKRATGFNVLHPMGWDAFGMPAENAAMERKVHPKQWTYANIAAMKKQLRSMGLSLDWAREIATCDPSYYRHQQKLFLDFLAAGLVERKSSKVNWDPVDQTVLANEQVIDGKGWRTGATVERREIPGYYYAQELLDHVQVGGDKATLTGWPEKVRLMQENWIGKSSGVRFAFTHDIRGADGQPIQDGRLYVFTTRADTIMGVTFCAVAPEHPLAQHAAASQPKLAAFIEECKKGGTTEAELALKEKEGMPTGLFVTHPLTGEQIEVWVGNYVLTSYGDGAVMGVPAHDERDFAFANKYGIEIIQVVLVDDEPHFDYHKWQDWYGDKQRGVTINSDNFSGMTYKEAVAAVAHALGQKGLGELQTTWRLRDWGVSRQRYWGTPIPIIHCEEHGAVPVPEKDLPVVLPTDCVPDGSGNPLHKHEGFHAGVVCPVCGKPARRETDTMDTFVDSSWYFMRYCDPKNDEAMVAGGADYWMPMDQYIGGIEHAILHLLYARFWTKVMRDLGLVKVDEPFTRLLTQGMVLNHIYSRRTAKGGKDYFWPRDVEHVLDASGKIVGARLIHPAESGDGLLPVGAAIDYEGVGTMSKSKNNGVDPQELIEKYGADTARLYTMFTAPPEATLEWNDAAVEGSYRFLRRVWNFGAAQADVAPVAAAGQAFGKGAQALRREVHTVLRQVDYDYQRMQYNTVVSGAMKLLNALEGFKPDGSAGDAAAVREGFGILLRCLYPATPHIAQQLWNELGYDKDLGGLLDAPWPTVDVGALVQDEIELMLQVNGKLRGKLSVPAGASKDEIEKLALACDDFVAFAEGAQPKRVIVVPGRLVNVVL
mgnify:CR=1 FL=1